MSEEASSAHAAVIRRLARGYEVDPGTQRDLLQEIHAEPLLSLKSFDGRCGLRPGSIELRTTLVPPTLCEAAGWPLDWLTWRRWKADPLWPMSGHNRIAGCRSRCFWISSAS